MEMLLRVGLGNAVAAGVLALFAATAGVFARGRPALRHGLWLLVLVKLVTPPLWTVPVAWVTEPPVATPQPQEAPGLLSGVEPDAIAEDGEPAPGFEVEGDTEVDVKTVAEVVRAAEPAVPSGRGWLLAVWVGGSLLTFALAAWRIERFQRILRRAEPAPVGLEAQVEALAQRLGLGPGQCPRVGLVPGAVSPMIWALLCRPHLLVPRELWERLDAGQRATLLVHELAHLKRRDHWVRWLELLGTGLYWWLPVVWIARQALREAEEQCCDAWVVWAFPGASRTYAEALLETLDFLSGTAPAATVAASGLGPVHHLKRRMTMIMQGTTPRRLTWSGLLVVLGLSAAMLPLSPTWAQRPTLEDAFFNTLKQDHEFNDPRWPFLIKVKDVRDKTLIGATFKRRAGGDANPNSFDMVVEAEKATIEFDASKGEARVSLEGAEVTNPREDGSLLDAQTLVIPMPVLEGAGAQSAAPEEDVEEVSSAADEPAARDPGPRRKGDREQPSPRSGRVRREVRTFRNEAERGKEASETLESMVAKIKELAAVMAREPFSNQTRAELDRAVRQLEALARRSRGKVSESEGEPKKRGDAEEPASRKPEAGKRLDGAAAKEGPQAKEREELRRLRAEVMERQKAFMEAQRRLSEAIRQEAEKAGGRPPLARGERFEFRFGRPGGGPPGPGLSRPGGGPPGPMRMIPDGPLNRWDQPRPGEGPPGPQRMIPGPDQERRIAELEERLEKLQNEVKGLKQDPPTPR